MGTTWGPFTNMRMQQRDRLFVFAHGRTPPTDEEWDVVLEAYSTVPDLNEARSLIYTDGAAPTVLQRGKLNDLLMGRQPRIAVLTPSKLARAAGAALRWFNPRFRVFNPTDYDGAMSHLEVTRDEATSLMSMLASAKADLGLASHGASAV